MIKTWGMRDNDIPEGCAVVYVGMPIVVFNAWEAIVEAAKEFVEVNKDDCYQDDTEYGARGRNLMEAVEAYARVNADD